MPEKPAAISPLRILVVDDEVTIQVTLGACLEADGHHVQAHGNPHDALAAAAVHAFDLIFLDVRLGTESGLDYIRPLLAFNPWAKIVVITAYASIETAVEAMKRGAADYLAKPFSPSQVELVTRSVAERRRLELQVQSLQSALGDDPEADFISSSSAMQRTLKMARQVAGSSAPVLISGEIGTGKGHVARDIHAWSPRSQSTYAVTSCLAASAESLEDELFGLASESGGDVPPEKLGRMIFCNGGTLVLDEIGAMPLSLQWKLERLLNEHRYERRDDYAVRQADVRLIATTSIDLQEAVKQNRFRRELLLSLDVVQIDIPPLRQCPGDIRALAERYLAYYGRQYNRRVAGFSNDAENALQNHDWPGNHRELRNLIERAVILCDGDYIEIGHFPPNFSNSAPAYQPGDLVPLDTIENLHIRGVMEAAGTMKGAASILGINYSTLWRRLRKNASSTSAPDATDTSGSKPTDEQPAK